MDYRLFSRSTGLKFFALRVSLLLPSFSRKFLEARGPLSNSFNFLSFDFDRGLTEAPSLSFSSVGTEVQWAGLGFSQLYSTSPARVFASAAGPAAVELPLLMLAVA